MKKKNIIFICTDQHRKDTLAAYCRGTLCRTPNLDALAGESLVFDNAYTTCPVCTPARSSMQTGLYPSKTGMETNSYQSGCCTHELSDMPYLLSRRLQAAGYRCGYTGKWHLGVGRDKSATEEGRNLLKLLDKGFLDVAPYVGGGCVPTEVGYEGDDFPGHGAGGWGFPQYRDYLKNNGLELKIEGVTGGKLPGDHSTLGEVTSPIETTVEYYLVERAKAIVDELAAGEQPFYFQLNFWGPHEPYYAPTQYLDLYRGMTIPQNPTFAEDYAAAPRCYDLIRRPEAGWDFFQETLRYYYACTTHIDAQIGRFIAYLKEKGLYDDTVLIFSADHGDNQGCHGGLENKSYSMYDDTTCIPLFLKPARRGYAGARTAALVGTCDLYATILQEAGYVPQDEYGYGDGRPLGGFVDDPAQAWSDEIVCEGMGAASVVVTQRMFRKGRYKYVFNGADRDQLFDMEADPLEQHDLAADPAAAPLLHTMRNGLADWMQAHNDPIRDMYCKLNRLKEWEDRYAAMGMRSAHSAELLHQLG